MRARLAVSALGGGLVWAGNSDKAPVNTKVSALLSPELSVAKRKKSGNAAFKCQFRAPVVCANRLRQMKSGSQARDRVLIAKGGAVPEMFKCDRYGRQSVRIATVRS
jgi:hypothetical protein